MKMVVLDSIFIIEHFLRSAASDGSLIGPLRVEKMKAMEVKKMDAAMREEMKRIAY